MREDYKESKPMERNKDEMTTVTKAKRKRVCREKK